jgi:molybdopterin converting factor small subunit
MSRKSGEASSHLGILTASFAGLAVGIVVTLALFEGPQGTPPYISASGEKQFADMAAVLEALAESFARHETQVDDELIRIEQILSASIEQLGMERVDSDRQVVEPTSGDDSDEVGDPSGWVGLLDKDIGRALVERGLTPFDTRVVEHVRTAGMAVRKLEDDYQAKAEPIREEFKASLISAVQMNELLRGLHKQLQDDKERVIEVLEAALDSLFD